MRSAGLFFHLRPTPAFSTTNQEAQKHMRSFLTIAALLATGCSTRTTPVASPFMVGNAEEVGSDTGSEDTGSGDTAVETDTGTAEDTAAVPACKFNVSTWDGEVEMGNTLSVTLNESSPSGEAVPGRIDVLTVDFTADDPDCADLLVTSFGVKGVWTDGAAYVDENGYPQHGWTPTWVGAAIDEELVAGVAPTNPTGNETFAYMMYPFVVHAGETVTVTVSASLYGASPELNDTALFNVIGSAIGVYDGQSDPRVLNGDDVIGSTIAF